MASKLSLAPASTSFVREGQWGASRALLKLRTTLSDEFEMAVREHLWRHGHSLETRCETLVSLVASASPTEAARAWS
eukprot:CAMPEP_0174743334 /NCGR_PEP_ID=MMETSP1094-20130205/81365_1 /TAXON_ID=156173 /ORGANISM="Chrysochromulina brevifilum, Strain UTEX LB 985" /LENGTH=76 /DNA_ID=CAMNT_0015947537 /DNA_START=554 /DNA_END=784 /DNA_ORIENTATION=+